MDPRSWLQAELAAVEAELQGQGPTCRLDRTRSTPPPLKYSEGRYAMLRRAARLLERGEGLAPLAEEGARAAAQLAAGPRGLAADRAWAAYLEGVRDTVAALGERFGPLAEGGAQGARP